MIVFSDKSVESCLDRDISRACLEWSVPSTIRTCLVHTVGTSSFAEVEE